MTTRIRATRRATQTMMPAMIPASRLVGSASVGLGLGANSNDHNDVKLAVWNDSDKPPNDTIITVSFIIFFSIHC